MSGLLAAVALLLSAWALGRRMLARRRDDLDPLLFEACAAGAGLGAWGLGTFLLGTAGLLHPWIFRIALAAGATLALKDLHAMAPTLRACRMDAIGLLQGAFAALPVLAAALGILSPPTDYDSLEYHLGAPAAYLRQSRISFLADNAYASFPQQQEMLYLAGLAATGDHAGGAVCAKGLNLACWILAATVLLALGRRYGSTRSGGWAALALLASPWVRDSGGWLVYNEPGFALFALLAFAMALEGDSLLSGIFAGLAFSVKYPAALLIVLPLVVALGLRRASDLPRFLLAAAVPAAPWLLRNLLAVGNPVYPLLTGVFGPAGFDAVRFDAAHAPGPSDPTRLLAALAEAGKGLLLPGALLVFVAFGWSRRDPGRRARLLALLWVAVGFVLWFRFTHRLDRFLLPLLPALCLAVGFGVEAMARLPGGWLGRVVPLASVLWTAGMGFWGGAEALKDGLYGEGWEKALADRLRKTQATYSHEAILRVNALPAGSRVLFVGEAETFYVRLDGAVKIVAPTVFDAKPFEGAVEASQGDWKDCAERLKALGFSHLYVNWPELRRLQTTYGDRKRGYSRLLTSTPAEGPGPQDNFFDRLEEAGLAVRLWEEGQGRWRLLEIQ